MDSGSVKNGPIWPFSSSANTYISALCCLTYALLSTSPSTNRQQGHLFILEPAHHSHPLRLYHEHYVYSPIHFSGASTLPCAWPVWSQTTISRVTRRQTVTVTNDCARFGHRVGPGWAQHVTAEQIHFSGSARISLLVPPFKSPPLIICTQLYE